MTKELIICSIIFVLIIGSDILIGKFVDSKMNHTIDLLQEVKKDIEVKNFNDANEKIGEIDRYWDESEEVLSFYIEHDELEKVNTELTSLKTFLKLENEDALEKLENMSFIIEHIEEKDDLKLKNIF